jgi:cysteine desulfurase/selenocysteine lyase
MPRIENCREDFPIFNSKENSSLIYFDNASTTQKPNCVIQEITDFYSNRYSNIHRGLYPLSLNVSEEYEKTRENIRKFINAKNVKEIIFTKGTTEGINMLSYCLGEYYFKKGDEIILSILEHHSNIVPWQVLAKKIGLKLKFINVNSDCEISLENLNNSINNNTKLIAITHISNSTGIINPIEEIIKIAKTKDVLVMVDGAQSIGHKTIDVQKIGCDFFVFSGHKTYGPTGTGILYVKERHLEKFAPYQTGGNQIKSVSIHDTVFADAPFKFEPGTPNISGFLGLSKAIDYINSIGFEAIEAHEKALTTAFIQKTERLPNITIVGNPKNRSGIISLTFNKIHPIDIGILLGQAGVCIRVGMHCNEPLMNFLNIDGTVRISLAIYNNLNDIDIFFEKLKLVEKMLDGVVNN